MSRIRCETDASESAPCICDPVTGCGHASSWHRVTVRWVAKCVVPDCDCASMDVCDCVDGATAIEPDANVLSALGIML